MVIADKLGVCAELEAEMAHIVGSYQCEWKTTLQDPDKLKRFRQFINADGGDDNLVFVEERGQRRPATRRERLQAVAVE